MIAIAFNIDNEIFPLQIVKEENNVNWRWFLLLIQLHITGDCSDICIISDIHVDTKHGVNRLDIIGVILDTWQGISITNSKICQQKKSCFGCTMNLWSLNLMNDLMIWVIVI